MSHIEPKETLSTALLHARQEDKLEYAENEDARRLC
jgi:hypothetical protein